MSVIFFQRESSIYPHQHIPETADLRIRVKVFSKNGCLFFVDSYICKPWPERLVLSGMMPWTQNINNHTMRIFFRLMIVAALAAANYIGADAQEPVLKFNQDKKFKIVQFTDTHVIYEDKRCNEAMERMNEVLDAEKPDFVIYTGDLIFGRPAKESLLQAVEPVVSRGIPFGVTWGNHDDEELLTRQELFDVIKDLPNNLTGTTEGITGVTNYVLPVKSSDGDKYACVLYVFDSNSYSPMEEVDGYGWIKYDQIGWYKEQSAAFTEANRGNPLPAMAFFHIPLPEYHEAALNEDGFFLGTRKEKPCSPPVNSGLALAMVEARDVMAVSVGHDHVNDYVADWRNIMLCYGRYTGGSTVYNDIPGGNGARVFELTEGERSFRTWIRLKDGKVINEFSYPVDLER